MENTVQRFSEVPDQLVVDGHFVSYSRKSVTLDLFNAKFQLWIANLSVIPENPVFPNSVLPKTSVFWYEKWNICIKCYCYLLNGREIKWKKICKNTFFAATVSLITTHSLAWDKTTHTHTCVYKAYVCTERGEKQPFLRYNENVRIF